MKNNKTPLTVRKTVVTGIAVVLGGIMGGLLCSMGQDAGVYRGIEYANNSWETATNKVIVELKNRSEENKKED